MQFDEIQKYIQEKTEGRDTYLFPIDNLKWDRWGQVNSINDPVLQEELIKHNDALQRNVETFEVDIGAMERELENYKAQKRKKQPFSNDHVDLWIKVSELTLTVKVLKEDKVNYLNELPFCIEKTEKIYGKLIGRKEKIHNILNEGDYYDDSLLSNPEEFKVDR